jgi:DNA-binding response OmpR family regulator
MLSQALREWGYETLEAETTNAGLVQFEQAHPTIVLLDIGLPDGSGLELLHQIKRRRPNTAVIMMTGEVVVENTIAALRGGADDFVAKPIHLEELQFALKRALKTQRRTGGVLVLPRLLIVTDSRMRANHLLTALRITDIEVTVASTPAELARATEDEHDLVIVDVVATELRGVLAALRTSPAHAEVPILVEISRVAHTHDISGVMPQYRAMPCSPTELVTLARRRIASVTAPS